MYKVVIDDHQYKSYTYYKTSDLLPIDLQLCPLTHKLFSNDIFDIKDNIPVVSHSYALLCKHTCGVLSLKNTFGRCGKKFYYECIPNDKRLPHVLIPYSIKNTFHKKQLNLYVLFSYNEWKDKHPYGVLTEVLGSVDNLHTYYHYLLYCKNLNISIKKFNEDTTIALKKKQSEEVILDLCKTLQIQDRQHYKTFTIDSESCQDYDDALGFQDNILSVYIANVPLWLESLHLWRSFTRRVSTIYLPDKKRPMLPTILSDCLCSLQENQPRIAFTMDLHLNSDYSIKEITFCNSLIKIHKNFVYESDDLLKDKDYTHIFQIVQGFLKINPLIHHVSNSYELISYMAIFMNYECSKYMLSKNKGIFRSVQQKENENVPDSIPESAKLFFHNFSYCRAQYTSHIDSVYKSLMHKSIDSYLHITSPIRRLVDLLNMLMMQIELGLCEFTSDALDFYQIWIKDLEYINQSMRAIRKVQNKCEILDLCSRDNEQLVKTHSGYLFDRVKTHSGMYQYNVYLNHIKLVSRISLFTYYENYSEQQFKLFVFMDESNCKKKIRLQLL